MVESNYGPMRFVIFRHTADGDETYVRKLSMSGRVHEIREVKFAIAFSTASEAYDWCRGVPDLMDGEWRVGRRENAGVAFGKHNLWRKKSGGTDVAGQATA